MAWSVAFQEPVSQAHLAGNMAAVGAVEITAAAGQDQGDGRQVVTQNTVVGGVSPQGCVLPTFPAGEGYFDLHVSILLGIVNSVARLPGGTFPTHVLRQLKLPRQPRPQGEYKHVCGDMSRCLWITIYILVLAVVGVR